MCSCMPRACAALLRFVPGLFCLLFEYCGAPRVPDVCRLMAQVWTRLDTATGEAQLWSPGVRSFTEELIFVPGARGAEAEDDGYLLGMYYDAEAKRSCLVVRVLEIRV